MQKKQVSFNMQIGLWISLAAMLATASNPFSNSARVAGKDVLPVTPFGWSDPIVLTNASTTSHTSDATLEAGSNVYVDIAITNGGDTVITEDFDACLYLDDVLVNCWTIITDLAANTDYIVADNYMMTTTVSEGSHILQLRLDEAVAIASEANTSNNTFTADFMWTELTPSTTAGALDEGDALTVANINLPGDNLTNSNAPDQRDIASYMIGKVAVSVILPESTSGVNKENWSTAEIQQVKDEITEGLGDWESWYTTNNGGNPGLDFVIEWHTTADAAPVEIPDDMLFFSQGQADQDTWIEQSLTALGTTITGPEDYWDQLYKYNNALRTANSANWAFTIFVADSSADADGRFPAGGDFLTTGPYAYSYLNGPFIAMTYDNANWGIHQMSEVLARHVGHIFGAANQYPVLCPSGTFGYLAITNTCGGTDLMSTGQSTPDVTTREQVGWKDTDADQIFDPADTRPQIELFQDETYNTTPAFTGTNHTFSGSVYDEPLASARSITIRKIIAIQYRIDGGAWQNADITDAPLDSDYESFSFSTPNNLGGGTHVVEVRAQNDSTDPTNKYSALTTVPAGDFDPHSDLDTYAKMIFSNDYFTSAMIVTSPLPYTNPAINTVGFTANDIDPLDPNSLNPDPNNTLNKDLALRNCLGDPNVDRNAGDHSAWFVFTPTQFAAESITLNTLGSDFDTMIGAYLLDGEKLSQIGCDDDSGGNLKSLVTVAVGQGATYYFNVSSFAGTPNTNLPKMPGFFLEKADLGALSGGFDPGGNLVFNIISNGVITSAPTVVSSVRVNPNPTNFDTVHFKVTFSTTVTGVDEGDFNLTTSGVSGAAVSGISGSGNIYDVSVSTGSGSGSIRLNVAGNGTIEDNQSIPMGVPFNSGQTYIVDKLSPYVLSSSRTDPNPTSAAIVKYAVTFSQPVSGVNASDFVFQLAGSGVSTAAVVGITPASGYNTIYTVSVSTGTGNGTIRLEVANDHTIVNATANSLFSEFAGGETYRIKRTAIFDDVPFTYWANDFVERLFYAGVTGGCSAVPLNYCPDSTVTRGQMAVFLLKATHGSSYSPPVVGASTGFSDVPVDYWAAKWIKQLAAEGITGGCGSGIYCPDATVTRAQMAVFLLKSKHGSSYAPPAPTGVFVDVPIGYWADKWIERLAVEGVTSGCGAGIYCPDAEVTRAQMAVFLVKAFNMP